MDTFINEFNSDVKTLVRTYLQKNLSVDSVRIRSRLNLLINSNPLFLINEVGCHLLEYGEIIKRRDWDAFIEMKYSHKFSDESKKEASEHIYLIKKSFTSSSPREKEELGDIVVNMLSVYCKYLLFINSKGL